MPVLFPKNGARVGAYGDRKTPLLAGSRGRQKIVLAVRTVTGQRHRHVPCDTSFSRRTADIVMSSWVLLETSALNGWRDFLASGDILGQ
jgi:hypothetical protein